MKIFFKLILLLGVLVVHFSCGRTEIKPAHLDFPENGISCSGDFSIYKMSDNGKIILYVAAPMDSLSLDVGVGELFDFSMESHLRVGLVKYNKSWNRFTYCTDVDNNNDPSVINTYNAVEGFVILTQETEIDAEGVYDISAELENITFRDADGNELFIKSESFQSVSAGFFIP